MSKLIIIRGNSASGKTTTARALQQKLGQNTIVISQDMVRREILRVKDGFDTLALPLMKEMLLYGQKHCADMPAATRRKNSARQRCADGGTKRIFFRKSPKKFFRWSSVRTRFSPGFWMTLVCDLLEPGHTSGRTSITHTF